MAVFIVAFFPGATGRSLFSICPHHHLLDLDLHIFWLSPDAFLSVLLH